MDLASEDHRCWRRGVATPYNRAQGVERQNVPLVDHISQNRHMLIFLLRVCRPVVCSTSQIYGQNIRFFL